MNTRNTYYSLLRKHLSVVTAMAVAILSFSIVSARAQDSYTLPMGYITLKAAAGTGTAKKVTALSVPFYNSPTEKSAFTGTVSSLTASTFTDTAAKWTAGQLSAVATPYIFKITSGAAIGRTFLISTATANTATTVTIDSKDVTQTSLTTLGIVPGDSYEVFRCFTLAGLLGTPSTSGVLGGTSASTADSLVISSLGQLETYFYSTTLNRWTKVTLGNPDATNTPVRPDSGLLYSRLAATDLTLVIPGKVSTTTRVAAVKNSGTTLLAQNWPVKITLVDSKIQLIPTWTANVSVDLADKVKIVSDGVTSTYWFDGTNWRKQVSGSPIGDNDFIPAGSAVTLEQIGSQTGYSTLTQPTPYNLD